MVRFLTLRDDEEEDESLASIDEFNAKSSMAEALARLELYFSSPLSIFSNSLSRSRSMLRRLAKVSSILEPFGSNIKF